LLFQSKASQFSVFLGAELLARALAENKAMTRVEFFGSDIGSSLE
jgi:hypothetical protein